MVARNTRVLSDRFARAKRVVDFAGKSEALGEALVAYWDELNSLRLHEPRKGIARQ